ncbi:hypothetical protein B1C78_07980 [Thioalkalivibrio denitrificans]|uniref:UPF0250 protein B1C78_07980 n=1 Tax=Thioalkalivibrio denitrificans TaxID=108003 RepID=A0A1V3NI78_9GAMM|nr:DUF493 domain-containing protein [Thioalkalivibrio denitrificans]OOG24755.1 hypothetical protein B1C78_07980 [Thioalkalivibrio denitrificans]
MSDEGIMQFPCRFPLKVMGPAVPEFSERVAEIVERHAPGTPDDAYSRRPSSGGRYLAITVVVEARSQAQLDALYRELNACELVTMVL